ncbi:cytochrome P450 [Salinibacterium sp. ZJ450]|uniref:cytochrome P450 n=1 Tax=Salinibacterium sp. ZJ450 TaxID=2708338 RepID=UPI001748557E|nr:cytochrome P450 [Salinibacterium sp. ZJ450]
MVSGAVENMSQEAEIALGYHRTLEAKDFDAFHDIWTPDARHELPYHSTMGPPVHIGADAIAEDYRQMLGNRRDLQFTVHEVIVGDSNRVVLEYSGRSIVGETGGVYEQDYIAVFEIEDHRIKLMRLYADPERASAALQSLRDATGQASFSSTSFNGQGAAPTIASDPTTEAPPAFPQLRDDPLTPPPVYVQWREESPAKQVTLQNGKTAWVVLRQEEARQVFEDLTMSRDPGAAEFPQVRRSLSLRRNDLVMNHMDPPMHGKFRRMLAPWFTMKKINEQRDDIQRIVDDAIDRLMTLDKPVNFHKEFSLVIPSTVICRVLGIDYDYHADFEQHATVITRASSSAGDFDAAYKALSEICGRLVDESIENPAGGVLQVITDRLQAGEINREQAVANAYVLVVGGHETTAHTISLGFLQLFRDPALADFLRENTDRIPDAITEMMRIQSINEGTTARVTTTELDLGGVKIPAGAGVIPLMSPAHRDPRSWENADVFDIDRDNTKQLALGAGIHSCLGQNLARAELEIVFETVLRRIPTLRLAVSENDIEFQRDGFVFGVYAMPVTW